MKALIIFALIILISCDDDPEIGDTNIKCPDDKKIKIGEDVCAISVYGDTPATSFTYVKKKSCGKNKDCILKDDNYNVESTNTDYIYTCQKKLRLLKIDKKCNYNAECYTGFCSGGKCAAYNKDGCRRSRNCGPGKYCDTSGSTGKCVNLVSEDGSCNDDDECAPGLKCDSSTSKCKKQFTLDNGADTSDEDFCKTMFQYKGKCIEIVKVADDCSLTYKDKDGNEKTVTVAQDSSLDNGNDCEYEYRPKELIDDIVERYNKIKLNKLTEKKKENCDYQNYLCDKKYAELSFVYEAYDLLLEQSIIKANGEKNKDKKCEYEFVKSLISSSYVNVCYGFALALLGLLF